VPRSGLGAGPDPDVRTLAGLDWVCYIVQGAGQQRPSAGVVQPAPCRYSLADPLLLQLLLGKIVGRVTQVTQGLIPGH
jgi:hypothetical protein